MISHGHTSVSRADVTIEDIPTRAEQEKPFEDPAARRRFIRRVLLILMTQLLCTLGIVSVFVYVEVIHNYICDNRLPFYISTGTAILLFFGVTYCQAFRRKVPLNYITLVVFTILKSTSIAYATTVAEPMKVLIAIGVAAGMVGILSTFAIQIRYDFTVCNTLTFVTSTLGSVLGIVAVFVRDKILFITLSCLVALAAAWYLVYDLQMMMGGKRRYALHETEYTFGALNLYTDILLMFTQILNIVEANDD